MPTTYAHDLFGKLVYHNVDGELQKIIRKHKTSYRIGLHGPDILFYVRPFQKNHINRKGHQLHQETASGFFKRGKKLYAETGDEEVLAYLLGFLCHFILDSTCHPYISGYMKRSGAGHDEIETEFDRALMELTGKNPFQYHPADVIRLEHHSVDAITAVLDGPSRNDVLRALLGMKFYTGITVCTSKLKRRLLLAGARSCGIYRLVQGRVMRSRPVARCAESTTELLVLFRKALPEAISMAEEFYDERFQTEILNHRFDRNYK